MRGAEIENGALKLSRVMPWNFKGPKLHVPGSSATGH